MWEMKVVMPGRAGPRHAPPCPDIMQVLEDKYKESPKWGGGETQWFSKGQATDVFKGASRQDQGGLPATNMT